MASKPSRQSCLVRAAKPSTPIATLFELAMEFPEVVAAVQVLK
jgi:hypothetical protein